MKMNGKKGFIAVTLVMATILIGYFAPGWYTWTVHYSINPLTSFEDITITKTTGGTFGVQCWPDYGFETVGYGNVWLEDSSVGLYVDDGSEDWAAVDIEVDIPLNEITELSFWKKVVDGYCGWSGDFPCGWNPNIILAIDADDDGDFDGDLPGYHFTGDIGSDAFVEGESPVGLTEYDTEFELINAITDMKWWGADVDGDIGPYTSLSEWQSATHSEIDPTDHVKLIKIVIGGASSWMDEEAYVRLLSLNEEYIWYAEQIQIDQPLWVVFGVSRDDIEGLMDDYQCIGFSIHILDKATGELVYVLILPLIVEIAGVSKPAWELPEWCWPSDTNVGGKWSDMLDMALVWINLEPGDYGVIKDVIYWTDPITTEVLGGTFTVCIFGIEDEVFDTWEEHLP